MVVKSDVVSETLRADGVCITRYANGYREAQAPDTVSRLIVGADNFPVYANIQDNSALYSQLNDALMFGMKAA